MSEIDTDPMKSPQFQSELRLFKLLVVIVKAEVLEGFQATHSKLAVLSCNGIQKMKFFICQVKETVKVLGDAVGIVALGNDGDSSMEQVA